ncbi:hypothetical protein FRA_29c03950 [Francisella sp. W12-1067]|nr:hypothetical protein FRA_29c03950 [Francisella sp. W12-1067]
MVKLGISLMSKGSRYNKILEKDGGQTHYFGVNAKLWNEEKNSEILLNLIPQATNKDELIHFLIEGHGAKNSSHIQSNDHDPNHRFNLSLTYVSQAFTKIFESGFKQVVLELVSCSAAENGSSNESMFYNITESININEGAIFLAVAADQTLRGGIKDGYYTERLYQRYSPDTNKEQGFQNRLNDLISIKNPSNFDTKEISKFSKYLNRINDQLDEEILSLETGILEEEANKAKAAKLQWLHAAKMVNYTKKSNKLNTLYDQQLENLNKATSRVGHAENYYYCVKKYAEIKNLTMSRILNGKLSEITKDKYYQPTKHIRQIMDAARKLSKTYGSYDLMKQDFISKL